MRTIYLILLALLITAGATAQEEENGDGNYADSLPPVKPIKGFPFTIFVGKKYYQNSFYNQLNDLSNPSLNAPVTYVGLGFTGHFLITRDYSYYGHLALLYILPQKIRVDSGQAGKISGYVFSASVLGWDFFRKKNNLDVIVSLGANLGRLRILKNEALNQKNPIVAPMLAFSPAVKIGKIKVSLNVQYDIDLSGTAWRRRVLSKTGKIPLDRFNQSGLSAFFCVGMDVD